jgi:hypothetical protein
MVVTTANGSCDVAFALMAENVNHGEISVGAMESGNHRKATDAGLSPLTVASENHRNVYEGEARARIAATRYVVEVDATAIESASDNDGCFDGSRALSCYTSWMSSSYYCLNSSLTRRNFRQAIGLLPRLPHGLL